MAFFDLLQDGFVKTHSELFRLINFEEARRREAGPKAPLWSKKTLEQQPDKLCMVARRLMQAESAMRLSEYMITCRSSEAWQCFGYVCLSVCHCYNI